MKTLMLLNPRRRRKARKATKTAARKVRRTIRRRVRRSATKARTIVVQSRPAKRQIRSVSIRTNPRRRRGYRRSIRRNPFRGGKGFGLSSLKSVISKDNLTMAGGAVGASLLTQFVLARFGSKLPMAAPGADGKAPGQMLYTLGIPVVGALLVSKFSKPLAQGMLLGGLIDTITVAISNYVPGVREAVTGTGEYLAYLDNPNVLPVSGAVGVLPPGYMGMSQFNRVSPVNGALDNSAAFRSDNWAGN